MILLDDEESHPAFWRTERNYSVFLLPTLCVTQLDNQSQRKWSTDKDERGGEEKLPGSNTPVINQILALSCLCLLRYVCDICNAQTSGMRFKAAHSALRRHFSAFPLALVFSLVPCPSSKRRCLLQILFSSLSQLTAWHTFQSSKSPRLRKEMKTHARTHIGVQVNTCNHMQTQVHAGMWGHRHNLIHRWMYAPREAARTHTHTHTHTHIYIHTHEHSPPKSSSVMPSHPTLDKPLCEPDKAGEGTQQPLNTGAGCIRQLGVPADCIHTRNWRVLYLVLCDSGKTFQELHLNGFVISPLIDSSKWWPAVRPSR